MVFELALLAKDQEDHNRFTTVDWQAITAGTLCGQLGDIGAGSMDTVLQPFGRPWMDDETIVSTDLAWRLDKDLPQHLQRTHRMWIPLSTQPAPPIYSPHHFVSYHIAILTPALTKLHKNHS